MKISKKEMRKKKAPRNKNLMSTANFLDKR